MEKKAPPSDAWSPTKGLNPAFDYNSPDSKDDAMGPPKAHKPDAAPSWNEFTQSTTIHGVKYIFDPSSKNKFRRLFWICVCLFALIYFVIQLSRSIIKYYEYGTTTDVQVKYEESVLFPAVTLCNQNNFRTTATADFELYEYIDDIFSKSKDFDPDKHAWQNVNTTDFINKTAHQLEDFVDSCTWTGRDCNVSYDFERIFTAIGVCYTFNRGSKPRYATEPGSSTGLSLVLNVEQYEYMRGPNSDAGIKVLLHDPSDKPQMADQGFVVAPGTHTLVTILQKKVTSLPYPWGTCEVNVPSYHTCQAECRHLKAAERCGCRDVYMGDLIGAPETKCNMNDSFTCMREAVEYVREQKNDCNCSVTCTRNLFEPSLSYATLSEFNIDQVALTTTTKKNAVKVKFEAATEKQQRVVESIKTEDQAAMNRLLSTARSISEALNTTLTRTSNTTTTSEFYQIPDVLNEELSYPLTDVTNAQSYSWQLRRNKESVQISFKETRNELDAFIKSILFYESGNSSSLAVVKYCIDEDLTGNDQKQEVCQGMGGHGGPPGPPGPPTTTTQAPIQINCDQDYVAHFCFLDEFTNQVDKLLKDETKLRNTANQEMTKLQTYINIVNSTYPYQTLNAVDYADHYTCLTNLADYQNIVLPSFLKFVDTVVLLTNMTSLTNLESTMTTLQTLLDTTLGPNLLKSDPDKRWKNDQAAGPSGPSGPGDSHDDDGSDGEALKCSWYSDTYDKEVKDWAENLYSVENKVTTKHTTMKTKFQALNDQLQKMSEHYGEHLKEPIEKIQCYIDGTITKQELAGVLSDQDLTRAIAELSTVNNDLATAVKLFQTAYQAFPSKMLEFYERMMEIDFPYINDDTKANYPFLEQLMSWYNNLGGKQLLEDHLQNEKLHGKSFPANTNFTELNIWMSLSDNIEGFRGKGLSALTSAITSQITNPTKAMLSQLDTMIASMVEYEEKISMNTEFYMKNFLQLDIFYKELSHDTIEQQKAFEFGSLLGEVGGFLGLLLGASVVTLCELLDYTVMHCMAGCRRRKRTDDVASFSSQADLHANKPEEKKLPPNYGMYE